MTKDLLYAVDKKTNEFYEYGDIQSNFNLSFVIDGTKDTAKIICFNHDENELEAYTIIKHENTNSWWIVSSDRVERYPNDDEYLYKHTLQLQGAIELTNARVLTDCGFYQNKYTIESFLERLFALSSFEYNVSFYSYTLDLNQNIDYVKSFENYTLLSAIRELLNGYNCSPRLDFVVVNNRVVSANLVIIPKTGDNSLGVIDINEFDEVQEIKSMKKESFGTSIVSNTENVFSTKAKVYPSVGVAKLSANERVITPENAILRLPSNIYSVNWVQLVVPTIITLKLLTFETQAISFSLDSEESIKNGLIAWLTKLGNEVDVAYSLLINVLNFDEIAHKIALGMRTTLYTGWRYDGVNNSYIAPKNNPNFYFPNIRKHEFRPQNIDIYYGKLVIATKEVRDTIAYPTGVISFQRGSNTIENFNFLSNVNDANYRSDLIGYGYTDLRISQDAPTIVDELYELSEDFAATVKIQLQAKSSNFINTYNLGFRVNYVPMSDIKIKYDNSLNSKDIKLYNQNGKQNDSNALSKLILSHSQEIQFGEITRYKSYYSYRDVPQVGQIVNKNGEKFVINNISLNFFVNEYEYFIAGEFTFSKSISTKSAMVSPNTDIRDYGIPQKYNVKRKQLYRDFYEFSHSWDSEADNDTYLELNKILNFTSFYSEYSEHVAIMKIVYDTQVGGNDEIEPPIESKDTWYYQLNTSTFIMKKALYEVVDFKDNNIIGYGNSNASSGFDVRKLLTGNLDNINTPITYTDDNGEFKDITLCFCNSTQTNEILKDYQAYLDTESDSVLALSFNFIASEIYEGVSGEFLGAKDKNDFVITCENYLKDPIEVPMFEYICQLNDSDDVVVGENILENFENDLVYVYRIVIVDKSYGGIDNNSWSLYSIGSDIRVAGTNDEIFLSGNVAKIDYIYSLVDNTPQNRELVISRFSYYSFNSETFEENLTNKVNFTKAELKNKEIIIFRKAIMNDWKKTYYGGNTYVEKTKDDLLFVIRNTDDINIDQNGSIRIKVNHYKLN